ncbi:hypothetical protein FVE85_0696 [Porphyridium purpureum]|uniref:Vesicle tethering protein Uso1/P115-like head domain-containing protein n=1 Tax=Porphyridium purpureum TaxID=35688 RepID=A0A5J4Z2S5_PORPP|nr:hypothetical protein FVE85_0696 [Porphyridium purpureum]|eukprot:POR8760..scf208_2
MSRFLSGAISYIAGADAAHVSPVQRLVERIKASALPADRRHAIAELAEVVAMHPRFQQEAGRMGMFVLAAVLEQDRAYESTMRACLELLIQLCGRLDMHVAKETRARRRKDAQQLNNVANESDAEHGSGGSALQDMLDDDFYELDTGPSSSDGTIPEAQQAARARWETVAAEVASENCRSFVALPNGVSQVLELLEEDDFYLRFNTIELMTALCVGQLEMVQSCVLENPTSLTRLVEMLRDKRQVIVNNVLLLLIALCERRPEISKILAFDNIFEVLFDIVESSTSSAFSRAGSFQLDEGFGDDTEPDLEDMVVVHDCLHLINNLLKGNPSNQAYFRETGCIPRMNPMLDIKGLCAAHESGRTGASSSGHARAVSAQEMRNFELAVHCVYLLVQGEGPDVAKNQDICASRGIFKAIVRFTFSPIARGKNNSTARLGVVCFDTLGGLIRNHDDNKRLLSTIPAMVTNSNHPGVVEEYASDTIEAGSQSALVACWNVVATAESAAVRAAAFRVVYEAICAEEDVPSTSFLTAITSNSTSTTKKMSGMQALAALIKAHLVGWPGAADGAAVFYASSLLCFLCLSRLDARSLLCRTTATSASSGSSGNSTGGNNSNDLLLSKVVRAMSRAQREHAPTAARVALLKLLCVWMYQCSDVIHAFLSSAMLLPLVVELIVKSHSRTDSVTEDSEIHVRGLAVLLLGICLEHEEDVSDRPGASGTTGPAVMITRSTLVEIITNRIGITTFTAKLDELRATDAFGAALTDTVNANIAPHVLLERELSSDKYTEKSGDGVRNHGTSGAVAGPLGHAMWYDRTFTVMFNDIYSKLHRHVVEWVITPGPKHHNHLAGSDLSTSSGATGMAVKDSNSVRIAGTERAGGSEVGTDHASESERGLASVVAAEASASYKELIREQDSIISDLRAEVARLNAAVSDSQSVYAEQADATEKAREMQVRMLAQDEELMSLRKDLQQQLDTCAAIQAALQEKTDDLASISRAYNDLEAEYNGGGAGGGGSREGREQTVTREQQEELNSLRTQLNQELQRREKLEKLLRQLESSEADAEDELEILRKERDEFAALLAGGASSGGGEAALQAELIAEQSKRVLAESSLERQRELVAQLEMEREKSVCDVAALRAELAQVQVRLDALTHHNSALEAENEGLKMSRTAAEKAERERFASLSAEYEARIAGLEASSDQAELEVRNQRLRELEAELDGVRSSLAQSLAAQEELRNALSDARHANDLVRKEKAAEIAENARLAALGRETERKLGDATQVNARKSAELEDSKRKLADAQESQRALEASMHEFRQVSQLRAEELGAALEKLEHSEHTNERMQSELARVSSELFAAMEERDALIAKEKEHQRELDRAAAQTMHSVEQETSTEREERIERDRQREAQLAVSEAEVERLQALVAASTTSTERSTGDLAALREQVDELMQSLDMSVSENKALADARDDLGRRVADLSGRLEAKEAELSKVSAEMTAARAERAHVAESLLHLKAENERLELELKEATVQLDIVKSDLVSATSNQSAHAANAQSAHERMNDLVAERDALALRVQALLLDVERLESEHVAAGASHATALAEARKSAEDAARENENLQHLLDDAAKERNAAEASAAAAAATSASVAGQLEQLNMAVKALEAQVDEYQDQVEMLELKLRDKTAAELSAVLEREQGAVIDQDALAEAERMQAELDSLRGLLEQKQRDVDTLSSELDAARAQGDHTVKQLRSSETRIAKIESEVTALREQLREAQERAAAAQHAEHELSVLQSRSAEEARDMKQLKLAHDALAPKLREAENACKRVEAELDSAKTGTQQHKAERDDLFKELQRAQKELADVRTELAAKEEQHIAAASALEAESKDHLLATTRARKSASDLESQVSLKTAALAQAQLDIERLNALQAESETAFAEYERAIAQLERQLEAVELARARDAELVAARDSRIESLVASSQELSEELSQVQANLALRETALDDALTASKKLDSFLASVRAELGETRDKLRTETERRKSEASGAMQLRVTLKDTESALSKAHATLKNMDAKLAEQDAALVSFEQSLSTTQAELASSRQSQQDTETERLRLEKETHALTLQVRLLRAKADKLAEAERQLQAVRDDLAKAEADLADARDGNELLETENGGLRERVERSEAAQALLEKERAQTMSDLQRTRERLEALDLNLGELLAERESDAERMAALETELEAHRARVVALEEEVESGEQKCVELTGRVGNLDALLADAEARQRKDASRAASLAKELDSWKASSAKLERDKDALDAWVRELEAQLQELPPLQAALEDTRAKLARSESDRGALDGLCERLKREMMSAMERLDEYEKAMNDSVNMYESQQAQLNAQIVNMTMERDAARVELHTLQAEADALHIAQERATREREIVAARLKELDAHIRSQRESHLAKLRDAEDLVASLQRDKATAQQRVAALESRVLAAERENEEARNALYDMQQEQSVLSTEAGEEHNALKKQVASLMAKLQGYAKLEAELQARAKELEAEVDRQRDLLARAATEKFKAASAVQNSLTSRQPSAISTRGGDAHIPFITSARPPPVSSPSHAAYTSPAFHTPPVRGPASATRVYAMSSAEQDDGGSEPDEYSLLRSQNEELLVMLADMEMKQAAGSVSHGSITPVDSSASSGVRAEAAAAAATPKQPRGTAPLPASGMASASVPSTARGRPVASKRQGLAAVMSPGDVPFAGLGPSAARSSSMGGRPRTPNLE